MKESAPRAFTFIGGSKANKRGLQPEPSGFRLQTLRVTEAKCHPTWLRSKNKNREEFQLWQQELQRKRSLLTVSPAT